LAFHTRVEVQDVYQEGISRLQPQDFRYAHELGYAIKLLGIAKRLGGTIQVRVHPAFVPIEHMLAKVDGAFNAIEIEGDLIGRVLFHGMGAGREPTTSAVIGDVVQVARMIGSGTEPVPSADFTESFEVLPMSCLESRYYLRLNVADRAGVLAEIAKVLGDRGISIASVLQKGSDQGTQAAEIVVTTHPASEQAMQDSLECIKGLEVVREISNLVRVEDWPTN
jgi:homoserine dehydrogenase